MTWKNTRISSDGTHHVYRDTSLPFYSTRFKWVLKFHEPGLAPAGDETGAFHINTNGEPIYKHRFLRTFGYYYHRAAVIMPEGWTHVDIHGNPVYSKRYAWVGNYQDELCVVRDFDGRYFHIDLDGNRIYAESFLYAGDYRDGIAVARVSPVACTHIDRMGNYVHGKYFLDLDVYHKGFARARDESGWFHIDMGGNPLYNERFNMIEPFYNGYALCETKSGKKVIITETGEIIHRLE